MAEVTEIDQVAEIAEVVEISDVTNPTENIDVVREFNKEMDLMRKVIIFILQLGRLLYLAQ